MQSANLDGDEESVQVGGDADTLASGCCALCGARASVDAAVAREGVQMVTTVSRLTRARGGTVEKAGAMLTFADGRVVRGDGHSREEAICNALEQAGCSL